MCKLSSSPSPRKRRYGSNYNLSINNWIRFFIVFLSELIINSSIFSSISVLWCRIVHIINFIDCDLACNALAYLNNQKTKLSQAMHEQTIELLTNSCSIKVKLISFFFCYNGMRRRKMIAPPPPSPKKQNVSPPPFRRFC